MKKNRLAIATGILATTVVVLVAATHETNNRVCTKYTDISAYGVNQFIAMDLELIANFPTRDDWTNIEERITTVAPDSLRYIDSLDISTIADTLYVKIYSQNYAYRSSNTYTIAKNKNQSTDTLMIFNMDVDFKIKENVDDARDFRINNYTIEYIPRQKKSNTDKRIIFHKKFLQNK